MEIVQKETTAVRKTSNDTEDMIIDMFLSGNNVTLQDYIFEKASKIDHMLSACQREIDEVKSWGRFEAWFKKAHQKCADIDQKTNEALFLLTQQTGVMFDVLIRLSLSNLALAKTLAEGLLDNAHAIQNDANFSDKFKEHYTRSVENFKNIVNEQERAYEERKQKERVIEERLATLERDNGELLRKYYKLEGDTLARFGETRDSAASITGKSKLGIKKLAIGTKKSLLKYIFIPAIALIVLYIVLSTLFPAVFSGTPPAVR